MRAWKKHRKLHAAIFNVLASVQVLKQQSLDLKVCASGKKNENFTGIDD